MGFIITAFAPEVKDLEIRELYKKEHIRRSIENLVKLENIKCGVERKIVSRYNLDFEVIAVRCIDYSSFPISTVTIPIVTMQELSEMCGCFKTIKYAKEYLENRDYALIDMVFEWIRCQKCKAEKLWEILLTIGLNKIINFDQVADLFIPDPLLLK